MGAVGISNMHRNCYGQDVLEEHLTSGGAKASVHTLCARAMCCADDLQRASKRTSLKMNCLTSLTTQANRES